MIKEPTTLKQWYSDLVIKSGKQYHVSAKFPANRLEDWWIPINPMAQMYFTYHTLAGLGKASHPLVAYDTSLLHCLNNGGFLPTSYGTLIRRDLIRVIDRLNNKLVARATFGQVTPYSLETRETPQAFWTFSVWRSEKTKTLWGSAIFSDCFTQPMLPYDLLGLYLIMHEIGQHFSEYKRMIGIFFHSIESRPIDKFDSTGCPFVAVPPKKEASLVLNLEKEIRKHSLLSVPPVKFPISNQSLYFLKGACQKWNKYRPMMVPPLPESFESEEKTPQ